jgi:hypothetical protein
MQVSKWLGHSSFVLTLSAYADYIREDELAAPSFARPVAAAAEKGSAAPEEGLRRRPRRAPDSCLVVLPHAGAVDHRAGNPPR